MAANKTKKKSAISKADAVRSLFTGKKKKVSFEAVAKAAGYTATKDVHHIMRRLKNRKLPLLTTYDTKTRTFSLAQ